MQLPKKPLQARPVEFRHVLRGHLVKPLSYLASAVTGAIREAHSGMGNIQAEPDHFYRACPFARHGAKDDPRVRVNRRPSGPASRCSPLVPRDGFRRAKREP
jgi:hypothetical protein